MNDHPVGTLPYHFRNIEEPRTTINRRHLLMDILTVAICGMICGADDWVAMEAFGKAKHDWFKGFLELPNGIPSHDTFGRVFARLCPEQFQQCFASLGSNPWPNASSRSSPSTEKPLVAPTIAAGARPLCTWSAPGPRPTG